VCQVQLQEFNRLYGRSPTHVDGHQHMHLCSNVVLSDIIPAGIRVRRNFTFWPGEKAWVNRMYRSSIDRLLARKHRLVDHFFSLATCLRMNQVGRVFDLAKRASVELMTHPIAAAEHEYLVSGENRQREFASA